jgi:hypothetical protein
MEQDMKRGKLEATIAKTLRNSVDYDTASPAEKKEAREMLKELRGLENGLDPVMVDFFTALFNAGVAHKAEMRKNETSNG